MATGSEHTHPPRLTAQDVGIAASELGPLPDDVIRNPAAGRLDVRKWFADPARPFEIEIGSGKGTFLVQEAARRSTTNFLGIEWAGEFYRHAEDRVRRHALTNVRLLCADATEFLRWRVESGIVRVIHLYFPDPWPKSRHHKKRSVRDDVLASVHRVLEPGGELRVVTDHAGYWTWMESHWRRWTKPDAWALMDGNQVPGERPDRAEGPFDLLPFERVGSAGSDELVGTNFERKYRREGRPFHAAVLRKNA